MKDTKRVSDTTSTTSEDVYVLKVMWYEIAGQCLCAVLLMWCDERHIQDIDKLGKFVYFF